MDLYLFFLHPLTDCDDFGYRISIIHVLLFIRSFISIYLKA
jgi:hypothetical protein